MSTQADTATSASRVVSASTLVNAPTAAIFELIADPEQQVRWDGNDNLEAADPGQRVVGVNQSFTMRLTNGAERENHVVEFEEGRLIAWMPAEVGGKPFGQLWRWELEPGADGSTLVTHTYDWTQLHNDPQRERRAAGFGQEQLMASVQRLKDLAEDGAFGTD